MNFSGHGGVPFNSKFDISQFVEDVISFLDNNNLDKVDIFGYSMGGYVALYLVKNYPERIGRVITLGTKFLWTPEIAKKETKMLNAEAIEAKVPAFAEFLAKLHNPNDWKMVLFKTSEMMIEMGEKNPLKLSDYTNISHRVKIGLAEQDEMVTLEETKNVVGQIPNATFYRIQNSKHPIEKVDIAILAKEIKDFLK